MFNANLEFPFSKLLLTNPTAIQGGGAYFAKLTIDSKPIRIQLPKASTKSGIITTKRECYTDLMYTSESEPTLISWVDYIEKRCKDMINEKKALWFSNELSSEDIDGMLIPLSRTYKGDAIVAIRVAIDTAKRNNCQIYDENENKIDDNDFITSDHIIIPLIVVDGIKFTSKSIEIVVKMVQIMVFNPVRNDCMISYKKENSIQCVQTTQPYVKHDINNANKIISLVSDDKSKSDISEPPTENLVREVPLGEISELPETDNLREIDISIEDSNPPIILKEPTELYMELYKTAKEKLRKLKEESFIAFLEAKQIKTKYNIDDFADGDKLPLL